MVNCPCLHCEGPHFDFQCPTPPLRRHIYNQKKDRPCYYCKGPHFDELCPAPHPRRQRQCPYDQKKDRACLYCDGPHFDYLCKSGRPQVTREPRQRPENLVMGTTKLKPWEKPFLPEKYHQCRRCSHSPVIYHPPRNSKVPTLGVGMHFDRFCPLFPWTLEPSPAPRLDTEYINHLMAPWANAEPIDQPIGSAIWAISHWLWNRLVYAFVGNTCGASYFVNASYFVWVHYKVKRDGKFKARLRALLHALPDDRNKSIPLAIRSNVCNEPPVDIHLLALMRTNQRKATQEATQSSFTHGHPPWYRAPATTV